MVNSTLSDSATVSAGEQVVSCDLAGGAALLDLKSNVYFTLNEVASAVWAIIQEPTPISRIRDRLLDQYDVDAGQCHADLTALLQQMADAGLITITDASVKIPGVEHV